MKDFLETKTLRLKCQTPIHIGSGDKLNKNEYVFDSKKGIVYLLRQDKWFKFLNTYQQAENISPNDKRNRGKKANSFEELARLMGHKTKDFLQEYKKFIKNNAVRENKQSLYDWCSENEIDMNEVNKCALSKAYINSEKKDLNDMMPFVRHADGHIYVPGSSIKGAIRTALLCLQIKNAAQYKSWQANLENINQNDKKQYGNLAKEIEKTIFSNYMGTADRDANAGINIMRGLRVSDAELCDKAVKTRIYRKYDISLHKDKLGETVKKLPLYRECAPAGCEFVFTISIEKQLMRLIGINSIEDIIAKAAEQTNNIISIEKDVFGQYKEYWNGKENMADIIIGGGTGFLTKTIVYSLLPRQEAVRVVSAYLDKVFTIRKKGLKYPVPMHNHKLFDKKLSPRTLKVAGDSNYMYHMGLCQLIMN